MANSPITVSFLTDVVDRAWGIRAVNVQSFPGEHSLTCRFDTGSGAVLVKSLTVGVAEASVEHTRLQGQLAIMAASREAGLPVARIIPAVDAALATIVQADDTAVLVHVMEWTEGVRIDSVPMTAALADSIGDTAGRFDAAVAHIAAPAHDTRHHWDAVSMRESLDQVIALMPDSAERDSVVLARNLWADIGQPRFDRLPRQWVHHDMHDFNLLVSGTNPERISGILDFGDTTYGLRVAEVAVAGAYAARASNQPQQVLDTVITSYERHIPLTADEHEVLLPLACARLALNLATWSTRAAQRNDTYAADRAAASGPALAALLPGIIRP